MDMHINRVNLPRATTPAQDIMNTAARHYRLAGPEKSKIQFFDIKTNKPLTLEQAVDKKSLYTDVYFKINGNDSKFGIGLSDAPDYVNLDVSGDKLPEFKEMYDVYNQRQDLMNREVINPRTGKADTFRNVAGDMYKGTFKNSFEMFPYDLDHLDLENNPFSKVRLLPRRINQAAGLMKLHKAPKEYFETIGYNYVKDVDQLFEDEMKLANEVLGPKQRKLYKPYMIAKGVAKKKDLRPDPQFIYTEGQIKALERGEDPFSLKRSKPKLKIDTDSRFNEVMKNIESQLGQALSPEQQKIIKAGKQAGFLDIGDLRKLILSGAKGANIVKGILIGTGVGEIALTLALEGIGPLEAVTRGEDFKRVIASSPMLGFALDVFGKEGFSKEELDKIVYSSGLNERSTSWG